MQFRTSILLVLTALCAALFGQSSIAASQLPTFQIKGTVKGTTGEAIYRVKVSFQSDQFSKSVLTDDTGVYEVDLPLGEYSMTAQGAGLRPYRRPLFRVTEPVSLVFDVTLRNFEGCDILVFNNSGQVTPDEWAAAQKESCLREDLLPVLSHGFQLSIRYESRALRGSTYSYDGKTSGQTDMPVFVAYNRFSVQADKIVFDSKHTTIKAIGHVIDVNEPDTIRRSDFMSYKIQASQVFPSTHGQTFHVKGKITDPDAGGIPGAKVAFQSKLLDKIVTADNEGAFEADLTLGDYTMMAKGQFLMTRRIQFRATSARAQTVNGTAYPVRQTCDLVWGSNREQNAELARDNCGGEDSFPVSSDAGVPFQLYIQFPKRRPNDGGYVYNSVKETTGDVVTPVFVEYNFFSLQANEVAYDAKNSTIKASGNVVVVDESSSTKRADSMTFKLENGRAMPLR